jgi:small subunit ribosomal protein S9
MATNFITAVGRRKTAIANVRMSPSQKATFLVNGKTPKEYFKTDERVRTSQEAFAMSGSAELYAVTARVEGGGISAQADALRHALSRALVKAEPKSRTPLKAAKFLMRDPRAKERKKPGLKKARKAPKWSKR